MSSLNEVRMSQICRKGRKSFQNKRIKLVRIGKKQEITQLLEYLFNNNQDPMQLDYFEDICNINFQTYSKLLHSDSSSYGQPKFFDDADDIPNYPVSCKLTFQDILGRPIKKTDKLKNKRKRRTLSHKTKKTSARKVRDYKKNICGYVIKKIMRELIYGNYKSYCQDLCNEQNISTQTLKVYLEPKIEKVTGPSYLPVLFQASKSEDIPVIKVFLKFTLWFLKQKYIRHILLDGRMEEKQTYIQYKNKVLIPLLQEIQSRMEIESNNTGLNDEKIEKEEDSNF